MGGHLLVGLGVEEGEGEVELRNLQGEREEVAEGEEGEEQGHLQEEREEVGEGEGLVLEMGVELQQLLFQEKRSST